MEVMGQIHASAALHPENGAQSTSLTARMGPSAGLNTLEKRKRKLFSFRRKSNQG